MAEIVNLRRARKAKARLEHDKQADANRARFGTPKKAREAAKTLREKEARQIDSHKIEREDGQ